MNNNKNLKEDYVKFMGNWMAGAAIGHGIAYVVCKVGVWALWLYFMYYMLKSCTGRV